MRGVKAKRIRAAARAATKHTKPAYDLNGLGAVTRWVRGYRRTYQDMKAAARKGAAQ